MHVLPNAALTSLVPATCMQCCSRAEPLNESSPPGAGAGLEVCSCLAGSLALGSLVILGEEVLLHTACWSMQFSIYSVAHASCFQQQQLIQQHNCRLAAGCNQRELLQLETLLRPLCSQHGRHHSVSSGHRPETWTCRLRLRPSTAQLRHRCSTSTAQRPACMTPSSNLCPGMLCCSQYPPRTGWPHAR